MGQLATLLTTGQLSPEQWARKHFAAVKDSVLATSMVANGGRAQMSPTAWGRAGAAIKAQYRHANKLLSRWEELSGEEREEYARRLVARSRRYAGAAVAAYENAVRARERDAGQKFERRVLGGVITRHCDGCIAQAGRGWQQIGSLLKIGECQCLSGCKCSFEFRLLPPEQGSTETNDPEVNQQS
jgi:hypothetical protein